MPWLGPAAVGQQADLEPIEEFEGLHRAKNLLPAADVDHLLSVVERDTITGKLV